MKRYQLINCKMLADDEGAMFYMKKYSNASKNCIEGVLFTCSSSLAQSAIDNLRCILNQQQEQGLH